jgi:hypothetical protein
MIFFCSYRKDFGSKLYLFPCKNYSFLGLLFFLDMYGWFKDDKYVIWMWIWLIMKNISLLDRIWSLWLVRFAYSPTNFIFWLGRLIFSVSINSHPDKFFEWNKCLWVSQMIVLIKTVSNTNSSLFCLSVIYI